ncbi:hypothetical protein BKK51_10220 [Rodentibacter trehalosifermentans]|uniref:Uncharacterized protein n=1 Tax=Rodentibacter trehalosifermentans TaxID=1908263 RepID=A0A1V3IP29_9PAST|nr:hypothetical protein [Rodentibacter trehalosifermentans]OOF44032.1 hypothetical protein BKK51_10220 [Rodentibacter trehalosifermentans]
MLKQFFDNVSLLIGAVVLAILSLIGLGYSLIVYPMITIIVLVALLFLPFFKRIEHLIDKKTELPKWITARNPTLRKLQEHIWSK